jgi:hypothetical protein
MAMTMLPKTRPDSSIPTASAARPNG